MPVNKMQSILENLVRKSDVQNVVVQIQQADGQSRFAGAAGAADPSRDLPMSLDTPYFIASVTKMYTTAVIIALHQEGQLGLDESIASYLPDPVLEGLHIYKGTDYSREIKLYQLVNQTSGLADYFEDSPKGGQSVFDELKGGRDLRLSLEQILGIVRTLPAHFEPGAKARYSDTNFQLLGAVIERVTGKPLASNFSERIFQPLGLQSTYLYDDHSEQTETPPALVYFNDQPAHMPQFMSSSKADGGLVSTASESLTFLRAFFAGQLFDAQILDRLTGEWNSIFFPMEYGYGLMRFKLPRIFSPFRPPPVFIGHSGSTGSFAFHHPERDLYLAGTINQISKPGRPFQLMSQLVSALD